MTTDVTYYRTKDSLEKAARKMEKLYMEISAGECACGESTVYRLYGQGGRLIAKLILCPSCWATRPYHQRG